MAGTPNFPNLPLGRTGYFLPAWDLLLNPQVVLTKLGPGLYAFQPTPLPTEVVLNLNMSLQRLLAPAQGSPNSPSPNAPGGMEFAGGPLTGFDFLFESTGTFTITPELFENTYANGKPPSQLVGVTPPPAPAVYDPTLALVPLSVPGLNTSGNVDVIQFRLVQPRVMGRNLLDNNLILVINLTSGGTPTINLVGLQLYFQQEP